MMVLSLRRHYIFILNDSIDASCNERRGMPPRLVVYYMDSNSLFAGLKRFKLAFHAWMQDRKCLARAEGGGVQRRPDAKNLPSYFYEFGRWSFQMGPAMELLNEVMDSIEQLEIQRRRHFFTFASLIVITTFIVLVGIDYMEDDVLENGIMWQNVKTV